MKIISILLIILISIIIVICYVTWSFNRIINKEIKIMLSNTHSEHKIVTIEMLKDLPQLIKNWLLNCRIIGKQKIYAVRLKQKGLMKTKTEETTWMKTNAEQYFSIDPPAFVWKVNMNMMSLPVNGRDKFINVK